MVEKKLEDTLKRDLIKMVEKLKKENKKLKGDVSEAKKLKKKVSELEEENKLLALQQDTEDDTDDVTRPVTASPKKGKKISQMDEFEIAEHMRNKLNKKQF